MPSVHEILTQQFRQWELCGRGWRVFDAPVYPEPPFSPFEGYHLLDTPGIDDGRRPTLLSSFVRKLSQKINGRPPESSIISEDAQELVPQLLIRDSLIELQISLPANLNIPKEHFEHFLSSLSLCHEPIAFELLGTSKHIRVQFAVHPHDAPLVGRQLQAYFPDATFVPTEKTLETAWNELREAEAAVVEFGLAHEFMLSLATTKLDPLIGLIGTLAELQAEELGLFQILFQPVHQPWAHSIMRSVTDIAEKPIFINAPELASAAEEKVSCPLYAAVVRIATRSQDFDCAWAIARDMAAALHVFAHPNGNELIPLTNDAYPYEDHVEDLIRRQSRRSGMLLNRDELIGFVHLPSEEVRSPKLIRQTAKTRAAPQAVLNSQGLVLGENAHAGRSVTVALTPEQRVRHTHIIGVSGTGKSTLLFNMIRQDIEHGQGVAVLDPHGDLIDRILGVIPQERIDDVVLVDPSDEEYAVGFNILSAHSDLEKNLLASDLVSVFQRLSTSWGDQLGSVLQNAILAFLESTRGGTLADLRRFLLETDFRAKFLETVRDADVVYYWRKVFPQLTGNKSIGPVLIRLDTFLGKKPIRHMVSQPENRLDFADITDTSKIFLAKLSEGLLGRENSCLLGALFVSKFQQLAMSRQAKQVAARRDYWIYIDEFANFITPSMAEILSGARKYRIGLTLAHHELHQLKADTKVESAVLTHPFTRVVFRVGDDDARKLAEGFSSFEARDLKNLETGQAVARVERSDFDFNLAIPLPNEPPHSEMAEKRHAVIIASRAKYADVRAEVEATLRKELEIEEPQRSPQPSAQKAKQQPVVRQVDQTAPLPPQLNASVEHGTPAQYKELGKGGKQHQAIQQQLKSAAEELGFRATIEKPILDRQDSIDLLLERADTIIACEISVTNTIDYETHNVSKCLKAGFPRVAVVCADENRLSRIKAAVEGRLGPEASHQISYFLPAQFVAHLKALAPPTPLPSPPAEFRGGRKVQRKYVEITPEERKAREDAALKLITEAMRKKSKQRPC